MSGTGWDKGDGDALSAKLPPGPSHLPRELVRNHQRRRILLAALDVFSERGFAAATVKDVIRAAHVSRATFYELFADKEACMAALVDEVGEWLESEVSAAAAESSSWEGKVRAGVTRSVELVAGDPRLAIFYVGEALAIYAPQVRIRQERMAERLCAALRLGRIESPRGDELPEIVEPALAWGAIYLVGRLVLREEGPDPAVLAAELTELILLPYRT